GTLTIAASDASGNPLADGAGSLALAAGSASALAAPSDAEAPISLVGSSSAASELASGQTVGRSALGAVSLAQSLGLPPAQSQSHQPQQPSTAAPLPSSNVLQHSGTNGLARIAVSTNSSSTALLARAAVDEALTDADLFMAIDESLLELLAGVSQRS